MNPELFVDIPFESPEAWGAFSLMHGLSHQTTYERMLANNLVPFYLPVMEFPREDNTQYLLDHWQVHQSQARLLELPGIPDLATVDLSDPQQYRDWLALHALVHANENARLRIE